MAIPVVDLDQFLQGTPARQAAFVQELGHAFEEVGFVSVTNHGIPADLIADLYRLVQSFFNLSEEQKRQYEVPGLAGQRGYTSFGKEHAKGSDAPDLKEFFQYGQTVSDGDPIRQEYPSNVNVSMPIAILKKAAVHCFPPSPNTLVSTVIISMVTCTMAIPYFAVFIIRLLPMNLNQPSVPSNMKTSI
jgi:isopenicillin N synthase-like dioxygenase